MDDGEDDGEPFLAHYARGGRAAFEASLCEIANLRAEQSSLHTSIDNFRFEEAKRQFQENASRLLEVVDRIEITIDRGDAYTYVTQIAEAMLFIGMRLGATDQAQALAAKALQRARGQESGKARKGKQGLWQAHADELMAKIEATNPSLSADELAQRVRSRWSRSDLDMPAHSIVSTYIRRKRREPQISNRTGSI